MLFSSWVAWWIDYLTVLRLNFLISRMHGIIVPPPKVAGRTTGSNACKGICRVPGTLWAGIAVLLGMTKRVNVVPKDIQ